MSKAKMEELGKDIVTIRECFSGAGFEKDSGGGVAMQPPSLLMLDVVFQELFRRGLDLSHTVVFRETLEEPLPVRHPRARR
jgi:hypothetical protein